MRDNKLYKKIPKTDGISEYYTDYDAMLKADLDTLYIALPNHLHFSFAEQALLANKHIILEKPITANSKQFHHLRALAKQKKKILIEAVTVHYLPAYRQLKQHIKRLGDIKIVSLNYSQYSSRYDRFKTGETPSVFDPKQSGGALMDLNVYNLHFAVGLFGKPLSCHYSANIERHIDTSGILLLGFPNFQAVCIGAKDCQAPIVLSIQGDKGSITVPMPANSMDCFSVHLNSGTNEQYYLKISHRMLPEFEHFVQIIDQQDYSTVEKMLDISENVIEILDLARRQQGILVN
ncbi:Gfo/Idh/MocA family protein [Rodentibacter caecimuris]|uniref:NAD(P)-dependent oxidoreductase n=1 Tax=Rodentibacter caecimuris TaxID=1796644 RepID=A0ABX3L2T1_9PAST|nr:NAD(P)-dependent oxidoreductase [Rodentibacter heylii]